MRRLIQATLAFPFPSKYFHSVITSPPYYSQREYRGKQTVDWPAGKYSPCTPLEPVIEVESMKCAYGHEPTIEGYIWHSILILRECRRVLRDDGVVWWNIGDCYSGESTHGGEKSDSLVPMAHVESKRVKRDKNDRLGNGQLAGIVPRLMLALQADGWTLRNELIWKKATSMPEPLTGWQYRHAVCSCVKELREATIVAATARDGTERHRSFTSKSGLSYADPNCAVCGGIGYTENIKFHRGSWRHTRNYESVLMLTKGMNYWADSEAVKHYNAELKTHSNPRTVVSPPFQPFKGDHFAVYPPELIRPLIKSSVPTRCCSVCGTGWSPEVVSKSIPRYLLPTDHPEYRPRKANSEFDKLKGPMRAYRVSEVKDYRASCTCNADSCAGRVLDPFVGSGTTLWVAEQENVIGFGLDINLDYMNSMAKHRGKDTLPKKSTKTRRHPEALF
jgi:DNA modification methylase